MPKKGLRVKEVKLVELIVYSAKTMTVKELGRELKVSERQVYRYLANPEVKEAVNRALDEKLWKLRPKAYRSLDNALEAGERWATELFIKLNGELTDKPTGREDDPIHYVVSYFNADDNGK